MIKNIFRLFLLIIASLITLSILYIFELPPFKVENTPIDIDNSLQNESENLPDKLKENNIARNKTYEEMVKRAEELEKSGFPSLAIAQWQEAYKKNPQNLNPLFEIGKIHIRTKNYAKAENIFQDLIKQDPNSIDAKIYLGKSLLNQRKITEAQNVFNSITSNNQITLYYKGIIAAFFGDHQQAQSLLNQAIAMGGDEDITKKSNNFLNAYNEFNFSTESPNIHLKVLLARSYNQCGEYEMAIPLLFEITKDKMDYRDAWILLGYAYLQTDKYQDAIEALERAKTLDKQKPETLFYLGLAYYSVNKFQEAENNLLLAKQYNFEPKILVDQKLAEVYLELQKFQESAQSYENVLSLNSQDVNYYIKPMWIYLEKINQPQKALKLAQKALEEHPKDAMAINLVGWALIYNNDFRKAENYLKTSIDINPLLDAPYLNLGLLYEVTKQEQKALKYYQKAHELGINDGVAISAATRYNNLLAQLNTTNSIQANILNQ